MPSFTIQQNGMHFCFLCLCFRNHVSVVCRFATMENLFGYKTWKRIRTHSGCKKPIKFAGFGSETLNNFNSLDHKNQTNSKSNSKRTRERKKDKREKGTGMQTSQIQIRSLCYPNKVGILGKSHQISVVFDQSECSTRVFDAHTHSVHCTMHTNLNIWNCNAKTENVNHIPYEISENLRYK